MDVKTEVEHGDVALLVEENCTDRNVVRIEILFDINLEVGQHIRNACTVGQKFCKQNFRKSGCNVYCDCVCEYVEEQTRGCRALLVGVLVRHFVGCHGCVGRIALDGFADNSRQHVFKRILAHIHEEFCVFAEQCFRVEIETCFAGVFVVVVVDAENVRFCSVKELTLVFVFVSVCTRDVVAVFEQIVLFAPNVDCDVEVTHVDAERRKNVELEAEVQTNREVDVERHIFRNLEFALHCAENAAQHIAECLVDSVVFVVESAVYPHIQTAVCFEG